MNNTDMIYTLYIYIDRLPRIMYNTEIHWEYMEIQWDIIGYNLQWDLYTYNHY